MINDIDKELNNEILWRYKELKNISRLFEKHTKKELIIIGTIQKERISNTAALILGLSKDPL